MAHAVEACVHCGFCLPTCPTYVELGEEMDSPRGRILLVKSALEGSISHEDALPYVDRCLGCMACVTACPSGVPYSELLIPYRELTESKRAHDPVDQLSSFMVRNTLPYPNRFRLAAATGKLAAPFKPFLPTQLSAMLNLLPGSMPPAQSLAAHYPAQGQQRARVALLSGCVQQALAPQITAATIRVLTRNGVEVLVPQDQGCCGSLFIHNGETHTARDLARRNLAAFPADVDAVITNAAGCGSGMKDYPLLFKGQPEEEQANAFAAKVKDISEFLDTLGLIPPTSSQHLKAAYHDACHLAHAQGVSAAPRRLLRAIPNLTLLEIPEGELCCGSAGTYNIEQPALAASIGHRKARNIITTGAEAIVMGNIGCMIQIRTHLEKLGHPIPILHTIELLDKAYN
jgi:glycolate oxidase iron-sulfur subunit